MAFYKHGRLEIHYELTGPDDRPVIVFVNGLTQAIHHWAWYRDYLNARGYRVLCYDLPGQGQSSKPVLHIDFDGQTEVLAGLLDHIKVEKAYVTGISFGGVIVLRFAILQADRCAGIIPMSTFAEMDGTLGKIGENLHIGMTHVGFEYLVDWFTAFNFSSRWLSANIEKVPAIKRASASINDLYAIQNLMESIRSFKGFADELDRITCPTLILNGEFDALTPRHLHEQMRQGIKNSRLLLLQHVVHAFTLEIPELVGRVFDNFVSEVESGTWKGDQSVWIAADDAEAPELMFPCRGDHLRAIPL